MTETRTSLKALYKKNEQETLKDFFKFLRFESISSEEEYKEPVLACAKWLKNYISNIGFKTELWETAGHPIIFASNLSAGPDKPILLIYNHYDVQPVDPLELWESPPFEPTIKNGEIVARGAQDNKGQCFYVLQALKLLLERDGTLPVNIKLCIEGEEETGSEALSKILPTKKTDLAADYLAIVDLGIPKMEKPALTLGVRGIVTFDLTVQGSNTDLHSGQHGGVTYNPIHALVEILAKLRDKDGAITIPEFYDDVLPLKPEERSQITLDFDLQDYKTTFGATPSGGEKKYNPNERAWTRPTLEINGISGGYTGKGFKTVIPAKASAKLSCRLVPAQDPYKIAQLVCNHIRSLAPDGIDIEIAIRPGVGSAVRSDVNSKIIQAFSKAYKDVFQIETGYIFQGGSIPIIQELAEASGASVALLGLGLPGDKIHAPNEHFGIERIEKGSLIIARALELLSG